MRASAPQHDARRPAVARIYPHASCVRRRFARAGRLTLDDVRCELNRAQDKMKPFFKEKKPVPEELTAEKVRCDARIAEISVEESALIEQRDAALGMIGNLVHDSVFVSDDEDLNPVVRTNGEFTSEDWMLSHIDLIQVSQPCGAPTRSRMGGRALRSSVLTVTTVTAPLRTRVSAVRFHSHVRVCRWREWLTRARALTSQAAADTSSRARACCSTRR